MNKSGKKRVLVGYGYSKVVFFLVFLSLSLFVVLPKKEGLVLGEQNEKGEGVNNSSEAGEDKSQEGKKESDGESSVVDVEKGVEDVGNEAKVDGVGQDDVQYKDEVTEIDDQEIKKEDYIDKEKPDNYDDVVVTSVSSALVVEPVQVESNSKEIEPVRENVFKAVRRKIGVVVKKNTLVVTPKVTESITPTPKQTETTKKKQKDADLIPEKTRLSYKMSGSQIVLKAEDVNGKSIPVDEENLRRMELSVRNKMEKNGVYLQIANNSQLAISKDRMMVVTDLPVSIDVETRGLAVKTTSGKQEILVMPDRAVQSLVDLGITAEINKRKVPTLLSSGNELVYKFDGTKEYKVFGLVETKVSVSVFVSAETGEVVSKQQPWLTRLVRILSV